MIRRSAAWAATAAIVVFRIVEALRSHVYGADLGVFWQAGHDALHRGDPWVPGFDYLPGSLALFAPLGSLPFPVARGLWLVVGTGLLAATAVAVARRTGTSPAVAVGLAFAVFPAESALEFANATVLELPCLVLLAGAVADRRWRRAAVVAAVAVLLKPLLVPCLLVFVVARRWRELATALAALLAVDLLALAIAGHTRAYVTQLRSSLHVADVDPRSADLGALVARHELTEPVAVVLGVAVVALAAVVVLRSARPVAQVTAPLAASFLVGPVCWAHYPLLLLPLLAELVLAARAPVRIAAWVSLVLLAAPEPVHGGLLLDVPPGPLYALLTAAIATTLAAAAADAVPPAARSVREHVTSRIEAVRAG